MYGMLLQRLLCYEILEYPRMYIYTIMGIYFLYYIDNILILRNYHILMIHRCVGDHRGDRNKFFPTSAVRFLTNDELGYVKAMKMGLQQMMTDDSSTSSNEQSTHCLNLQTDYAVSFSNEDSLIITISPTDQSSQLPSFKLSCMNGFDLIQWYETLEEYHCLPRRSSNPINQANNDSHNKKRKGRKKRGSCVIS
jgi:hypothetical protein